MLARAGLGGMFRQAARYGHALRSLSSGAQSAREKSLKRLTKQSKGGWTALLGGSAVLTGAIAYLIADEDVLKGRAPPISDFRTWVRVNIGAMVKPYAEPTRDALLPPWPLPGVPPGMPEPPTLVIDLEETLCCREWSRKHGWRYAKRPGFDAFLKELSKYYEIVLFSSQHMYVVAPFLESVMQKGMISHVLFRSDTKWKYGQCVKPLSLINRPQQRLIAVDDEADALQEDMQHALIVPPYTEPDAGDRVLLDLLPFLVALVTEDVKDYPRLLHELGTHDGAEAARIYRSRVVSSVAQKEARKSKGIGRFIQSSVPKPDFGAASEGGGRLTAKALADMDKAKVGPAAEPAKEKGGFWKMLDRQSKDKEERMARINEKFNDMMMRKEAEQREQAGN